MFPVEVFDFVCQALPPKSRPQEDNTRKASGRCVVIIPLFVREAARNVGSIIKAFILFTL